MYSQQQQRSRQLHQEGEGGDQMFSPIDEHQGRYSGAMQELNDVKYQRQQQQQQQRSGGGGGDYYNNSSNNNNNSSSNNRGGGGGGTDFSWTEGVSPSRSGRKRTGYNLE